MSTDPNLDDLKRRARRRLVGAIVIALAAAVFVPMLLESEQKPLGDDVAVRIPPIDDGKFVNQLNAPGKTAPVPLPAPAAPVQPKADPAPADNAAQAASDASPTPAAAAPAAPRKSLADAEQRVLGANSVAKSAAAAAVKAAPAASKAAAPAEPKSAPAPAVAVAAAKAAPAATGSFIVQLAAFSDDKGANSMSNKLKKAGYPAFIEPVTTSHGTLWRVRVGPFSSRDDASGARDKLKRDGYNGLVAANPHAP